MADGRKPSNLRAVRVPDDLWRAAQARAAQNGTTVSAVINQALTDYTWTVPEPVLRAAGV